MTTDNFEPILEHIANRIGLRARVSDRPEWGRAIRARMAVHRITRPQEYVQLLKSESVDTAGEWRWLLPLLTNGESYFLRDEGQFSLLRNCILPELIEKRRQQKSLRLWSAGCSTGEEPYSLAILIHELIPPHWNVLIVGTDVNEDALQKARRGVYSAWSFRTLPAEMRERYFHQARDGFELDNELRKLVHFERDNLSDNLNASTHYITQEMDLILCRNVLIYFQPEAVAHAVSRFASSLRENGYLLTGHAELHHHDTSPLRVRNFPESIAYQRCESSSSASLEPSTRQIATSFSTPKAETKPIPFSSVPRRVTVPDAVKKSPQVQKKQANLNDASEAEVLCQSARSYANAGRHKEAIDCCKGAITLDPVATEAYFIWGQVAQELRNWNEAKELYKKVIYLSPSHIQAHIELAAMYDLEADAERARRMRLAALTALGSMPTNAEVEALTRHLESLVNEKSSGSRN
jgi:chemotaxis protein methyltransferase CheR